MSEAWLERLQTTNPEIAGYLGRLVETSSMSKCTRESHEASKETDSWQYMEYVGIQEVCSEYNLELRNCKCGSTLAKRIKPQ